MVMIALLTQVKQGLKKMAKSRRFGPFASRIEIRQENRLNHGLKLTPKFQISQHVSISLHMVDFWFFGLETEQWEDK